jgi:hypothetical protein
MLKVRGKEIKWQFKFHKDFGLKTEKQIAEEAFVKIPVLVLALLAFGLVSFSIFIFVL